MADTPQHEQGKIETKNDLTGELPASIAVDLAGGDRTGG